MHDVGVRAGFYVAIRCIEEELGIDGFRIIARRALHHPSLGVVQRVARPVVGLRLKDDVVNASVHGSGPVISSGARRRGGVAMDCCDGSLRRWWGLGFKLGGVLTIIRKLGAYR